MGPADILRVRSERNALLPPSNAQAACVSQRVLGGLWNLAGSRCLIINVVQTYY